MRIAVSMELDGESGNLPIFQVWHPTLNTSSTYSKIGEVQLLEGNLMTSSEGNYSFVNISLNSSIQIEFQSGDVVGYYQPSNPQSRLWSIQTSEYTSYSNNVTSPLASIDINNVDNIETDRQPLIEVIIGKIKQICLLVYTYMATDYVLCITVQYRNYLKFIYAYII